MKDINQLKDNIKKLEEMVQKLSFLNREIYGIVCRSSTNKPKQGTLEPIRSKES